MSVPPRGTDWRVLHVVLRGDPARVERLLLDTVAPWAGAAVARGAIRRWYLVRPPRDPATGQAQVKLRFQGIDDRHLAEVRYRVLDFLMDSADGLAAPAAAAPERPGEPAESAVERPLAPEEGRFGGPEGMAVALEQFPEATRVAIEVMRATPPPADRRAAVADLLLASAVALGGGPEGATWLRGYAAAQAGPGAVPRADLARARAGAATAYAREPDAWTARLDRVVAAARDGTGVVGSWARVMAVTWSALVDLAGRGRLSLPPASIYATLVQMTHNRLGLDTQDNAWLALVLLDTVTRAGWDAGRPVSP